MCSYTSSRVPAPGCRAARSRAPRGPRREHRPVGLCGELTTSSRVRGVTASRTRSQSTPKPGRSSARAPRARRPVRSRVRRVVGGLQDDHLVAGAHHGMDGAEQRLGRTRGDGDLRRGVHASSVQVEHLGRDRLEQRWPAGHRGVLVDAGAHLLGDERDELRRRVEIGEALRQVDRAAFLREPRHDREDRRADARQLRWCSVSTPCVTASRTPPSPHDHPGVVAEVRRHDFRATAQQRPEMPPVLGDSATDDEHVRPEQRVVGRQHLVHRRGPCRPRQAAFRPHLRRSAVLGLLARTSRWPSSVFGTRRPSTKMAVPMPVPASAP